MVTSCSGSFTAAAELNLDLGIVGAHAGVGGGLFANIRLMVGHGYAVLIPGLPRRRGRLRPGGQGRRLAIAPGGVR